MQLFISYARVDRPYCIQIVQVLSIHSIWYDQRLYGSEDWWRTILRRLDWCEGFIYLISPESLRSEYCVKEFRLALEAGKHIFPVLLHPFDQLDLPPELSALQCIDFSEGLTEEAVSALLNAIHRTELEGYAQEPPPVPPPYSSTSPDLDIKVQTISELLRRAGMAMDHEDYDTAVYAFSEVLNRSNVPDMLRNEVRRLHRMAETKLEKDARIREAEVIYRPIVELSQHSATRVSARHLFVEYIKEFPDHDPENLRVFFQRYSSYTNGHGTASHRPPTLEWCAVSEGVLQIRDTFNAYSETTVHIDPFWVSKYPITNAQFQAFVDDPQGYAQARWWDFSPDARGWQRQNPAPIAPKRLDPDHPRTNISWYEAMAFCRWLSHKTGMHITLPTSEQWQYAAGGGDGRLHPWGNEFDPRRANTHESKRRSPISVTDPSHAVSPCGALGMVGNTWEWNIRSGTPDENGRSGDQVRAIHGGSFISKKERAKIPYHFNLSPATRAESIGFRVMTTAPPNHD